MMIKNKAFKYFWALLLITSVVIRIFLTADRDILALNSPHDEFWYIHTAFNKIWNTSYSEMSFMHLPIYSMWLDAIYILGIPSRLAIDVFWLIAVGYLSFAIQQLTRMVWLSVIFFIILIFHPYTVFIFDRALAETFLTVASTALLAGGIELWNCKESPFRWRKTVALTVYSVGFAVAFHTRKEGVVLFIPLLILLIISIFNPHSFWKIKSRIAVNLIIAPVLSTFFLGALLSGINYFKWGIWARYELAAPGYERAVAALNSIDNGSTPLQITVTKSMINMAYEVSPTFSELKPEMDGRTGKNWIAISAPFTSVTGEIGNGWFYWALRDVAAHSGWHTSAKFADGKYAAIADELNAAFSSGRLKKKFMLSSFLDPDYGKWMPLLPSSILNVLELVIQPPPNSLELPTENAGPGQFYEYFILTGRREPPTRINLNGWIIAPSGSLIGLGTPNSTFAWQQVREQRVDVPGAYAFNISSVEQRQPAELHLQLPDGRQGGVALNKLTAGIATSLSGAASNQIGIDNFELNKKPRRADKWLLNLSITYKWIGYLMFSITSIAILATLFSVRHINKFQVILPLLLISEIGMRVLLFGILDASSLSGTQARYILPVIPFFIFIGFFSIFTLFKILNKEKHEAPCSKKA